MDTHSYSINQNPCSSPPAKDSFGRPIGARVEVINIQSPPAVDVRSQSHGIVGKMVILTVVSAYVHARWTLGVHRLQAKSASEQLCRATGATSAHAYLGRGPCRSALEELLGPHV